MKKLRTGFTTGACAAAAARASVLMLREQRLVERVSIRLMDGKTASFKVHNPEFGEVHARCSIQKDAGDDPDCTNGLHIFAEVRTTDTEGISIREGEGVGTVTKPGLQIPVGEPAINPVPRRMIREAVSPFFHDGVAITISVPGGGKVAKQTFNEKLGIVGGISIIGTTGIVKPFSVSALKASIGLEIDVAAAAKSETLYLVPGNIGRSALLSQFHVEEEAVVMMSNYLGHALSSASGRFPRVVLAGHPGKLAKVLNGDYDTHSKNSKSALPLVRKLATERVSDKDLENGIESMTTVEGIVQLLPAGIKNRLFDDLASSIEHEVHGYLDGKTEVGVLLVDMRGNIIGRGGRMKAWGYG
jgi:cobalt-precorrin-5B (C1)-methyltransferase